MIDFLLRTIIVICSVLLIGNSILSYGTIKEKKIIPLTEKYAPTASAGEPIYNPIIRLVSLDGHAFCSAFVIDSNYAITAGHCLVEGSSLRKQMFKIFDDKGRDTKTQGKAAGVLPRSDLGLILGDFHNFRPAKVNLTEFGFNAPSGKPFRTCGYPYGQRTLVCNPFVPKTNEGFAIVGMGNLVPGMSGGPVYNPDTDEIVGLNDYATSGAVGVMPLQGILGGFEIE